jgi:putative ABC transport system ATP-binding protein
MSAVNMHSDIALQAERVTKAYGKGAGRVEVLRGLDLNVQQGEFVAIMGPSGCGKTTLLNILGLLTPADAGRVSLMGREVPANGNRRHQLRQKTLGFVFQRLNLLPALNALDNVRIAMRVRGLKDKGQSRAMLDRLGVADLSHRKPSEMSVGQQQRVAIARAMVHRPAILLADEPTGNLDSDNTHDLLDLIADLNRETLQTIVMITHSQDVANAADRTVHMNDGVICDA